MLVLFHHKLIINFIRKILFVLLFKKYCNEYYLRSAELPYAIALMTNMIIDQTDRQTDILLTERKSIQTYLS